MSYYCFLCNQEHEGVGTMEHFIPRSMGAPKDQYLAVCKDSNVRSNSVFDNDSRDLFFLARHKKTAVLKRYGEALLRDNSIKNCKFAYSEISPNPIGAEFNFVYDRELDKKIPNEDVYALIFPVGLDEEEKIKLMRGLGKISIGALAFLLKREGIGHALIQTIFSQVSITTLRNFALNNEWEKNSVNLRFSLGRSDILEKLQVSCEDQKKSNHVVEISFKKDSSIHIEGMLHSRCAWVLDCVSTIQFEEKILRLENPMTEINAPAILKDLTCCLDRICIVNPEYKGISPEMPLHWKQE